MKESQIEAKVRRYCHSQGLLCYKWTSPSYHGVPDRSIIGQGLVMFLELKAEGNKPTVFQLHELTKLQEAGMCALWRAGLEPSLRAIKQYFSLEEYSVI